MCAAPVASAASCPAHTRPRGLLRIHDVATADQRQAGAHRAQLSERTTEVCMARRNVKRPREDWVAGSGCPCGWHGLPRWLTALGTAGKVVGAGCTAENGSAEGTLQAADEHQQNSMEVQVCSGVVLLWVAATSCLITGTKAGHSYVRQPGRPHPRCQNMSNTLPCSAAGWGTLPGAQRRPWPSCSRHWTKPSR